MTSQTSDRRHEVRLTVPRHLTRPGRERLLGHLVDLSSTGVRIEHTDPVYEGCVCNVDLPPALGRGRFKGRVIWTKVQKPVQTFGGDTEVFYETGLAFVNITAEQRKALAVALKILQRDE